VELARATTSTTGEYVLTLRTSAESIDLVATAPNDLIALQPAIAITPHGQRTADLILKPALHIAGKVVALDGKTPHVQLVVELVRPEGAEMEVTSSLPRSNSIGSLTGNRVLRLKNHPSYVELPPNVFNHLNEATIEGWVKWDRIKPSRFFGYGDRPPPRGIYFGTGPPPDVGRDLSFSVFDSDGSWHNVALPGGIQAGSWCHIAAVTSPRGMKLYLNGVLVASNADPVAFSAPKNGNFLRLGQRPGAELSPEIGGLEGEMDEVRVWSRERTAEEIRASMFERLTGNEPDLAALWNFDDPAEPGRDVSTNRIDGKLIGKPRPRRKICPRYYLGGSLIHPANHCLARPSNFVNKGGRYNAPLPTRRAIIR
jgi:hypothetical protein